MSVDVDMCIALAAILKTANSTKDTKLSVGDIYETYATLCQKLAQKQSGPIYFAKILDEMDSLGFIVVKIISKGKYGRTRDILVPDWLRTPKNLQELKSTKDARELLIRRGDFIKEKGLYVAFYEWCAKRKERGVNHR